MQSRGIPFARTKNCQACIEMGKGKGYKKAMDNANKAIKSCTNCNGWLCGTHTGYVKAKVCQICSKGNSDTDSE